MSGWEAVLMALGGGGGVLASLGVRTRASVSYPLPPGEIWGILMATTPFTSDPLPRLMGTKWLANSTHYTPGSPTSVLIWGDHIYWVEPSLLG